MVETLLWAEHQNTIPNTFNMNDANQIGIVTFFFEFFCVYLIKRHNLQAFSIEFGSILHGI